MHSQTLGVLQTADVCEADGDAEALLDETACTHQLDRVQPALCQRRAFAWRCCRQRGTEHLADDLFDVRCKLVRVFRFRQRCLYLRAQNVLAHGRLEAVLAPEDRQILALAGKQRSAQATLHLARRRLADAARRNEDDRRQWHLGGVPHATRELLGKSAACSGIRHANVFRVPDLGHEDDLLPFRIQRHGKGGRTAGTQKLGRRVRDLGLDVCRKLVDAAKDDHVALAAGPCRMVSMRLCEAMAGQRGRLTR
jgi:hypothetical protein